MSKEVLDKSKKEERPFVKDGVPMVEKPLTEEEKEKEDIAQSIEILADAVVNGKIPRLNEENEVSESRNASTNKNSSATLTDTPFYYDKQLNDPRLVITLHPNAMYIGNNEWKPFPANECFSTSVLKPSTNFKYRKKPIAIAIANEDFSVNISNSWTDFGRDNPFESMFNSFKPYAPMISKLAQSAEVIQEIRDPNSGGTISGAMNKAIDFAQKHGEQFANILNRQLVVQGTRFSYYSGSSINFGNLSMRFTVFSDWVWDNLTGTVTFKTAQEQLEELYEYTVYKYKPVDGSSVGKMLADLTNSAIGSATEGFIEEILQWQMPPGGFQADLKSVDNIQQGTLKLRINSMYTLENLVITGMNIMFSRVPCKHPLIPGKIVPLYADVSLSMQPATLYSEKALRAFTEGKTMTEVIVDSGMRDITARKKYETLYEQLSSEQ